MPLLWPVLNDIVLEVVVEASASKAAPQESVNPLFCVIPNQ